MRKSGRRHEQITSEERKQLAALAGAIREREQKAKEAVLAHEEARTEFDYFLMNLRRKYLLKVGDSVSQESGAIVRV